MGLSGWQRWGILLSILWAIAAGVHQRSDDVEAADNYASFARRVCAEGKVIKQIADLTSCDNAMAANRASWLTESWANVSITALAPIPVFWLLIFITRYFVRAQVSGFRAVVPWGALSGIKKCFVAFCGVTGVAGLLYGAVVVMNLYADAAVPVALGFKVMVTKVGDDYVQASGTWTRSGSPAGSSIADPLQTSKIICNRLEGRCTESRASVGGNLLMADLIEYPIERWDNGIVVFKSDADCATELFTIDLMSETVNGAGRATNPDAAICKFRPGKEEKWTYRLADGFPVYWAMRAQSRPLPLKLFHALFGR